MPCESLSRFWKRSCYGRYSVKIAEKLLKIVRKILMSDYSDKMSDNLWNAFRQIESILEEAIEEENSNV